MDRYLEMVLDKKERLKTISQLKFFKNICSTLQTRLKINRNVNLSARDLVKQVYFDLPVESLRQLIRATIRLLIVNLRLPYFDSINYSKSECAWK